MSLLGQGNPCTGHCHHHGGVDQPVALDAAADRPTLFHEGGLFLTSSGCFAAAACAAFAAACVATHITFIFVLTSISSALGLSRSARRSSTAVAWPAASAGA